MTIMSPSVLSISAYIVMIPLPNAVIKKIEAMAEVAEIKISTVLYL
jgi:hypothetical protein